MYYVNLNFVSSRAKKNYMPWPFPITGQALQHPRTYLGLGSFRSTGFTTDELQDKGTWVTNALHLLVFPLAKKLPQADCQSWNNLCSRVLVAVSYRDILNVHRPQKNLSDRHYLSPGTLDDPFST